MQDNRLQVMMLDKGIGGELDLLSSRQRKLMIRVLERTIIRLNREGLYRWHF